MWRQIFCRPMRNLDTNCAIFLAGSLMVTLGISLIFILDPDAAVVNRIHLTLNLQLLGRRLFIPASESSSSSRASPNLWRIPKLIHYASEGNLMPQPYLQTMNSCLAANPDWSVWLWTESDVRLLLHRRFPGLLRLYQSLGSRAERQLLAKFPILFSMGGVFLEADMQCLRPLEAAVNQAGSAGAFVSEERPENYMILENSPFKLATGAMGASTENRWFGFVIDTMLGRVSHNWQDLSFDEKFLTNCYQLWLDVKGGNGATGLPALLPWQYFSSSLRDSGTMARLCQQLKEWPSLAKVYTIRQAACNSRWLTGTSSTSERSIGTRQYSLGQATQETGYFNATHQLGIKSYSESYNYT